MFRINTSKFVEHLRFLWKLLKIQKALAHQIVHVYTSQDIRWKLFEIIDNKILFLTSELVNNYKTK